MHVRWGAWRSVRFQAVLTAGGLLVIGAAGAALADLPLGTTSADFVDRGTPARTVEPPAPWMVNDEVVTSANCYSCHSAFEDPLTTVKPFRWKGSMHAHAGIDPIFQAAVTIAGQDAPGSTEICWRCHAPRGWLHGRVTPPTGNPSGSTLTEEDISEGVTCNACHRLVNPVYQVGSSPPEDEAIVNALSGQGLLPLGPGNATMVVDPMDVRRGPFDDALPPHQFLYSPFHRSSAMCGTCHDVSNPVLSRVGGATPAPGDTYTPNANGAPHPTGNRLDMFPEQRTYSEWLNSAYAQTPGGIDTNGRFGGNRTHVSQCQDCHMPAVTGQGCWEVFEPPVRDDLPYHGFLGANVFAIDLLLEIYGPNGEALFDEYTIDSLNRARSETIAMVQSATDTTLSQFAGELKARVTNFCGHKLMTGMPEGKRIWLNVKFFNGPTLLAERGGYDSSNAILDESTTKVYEQKFGLDASMAALTGLSAGESFHLVLNNTVVKDNRIPPPGFSNSAFNAVQAGHVGATYADGQNWDDTKFCIPAGATRAEVKLYYQTSSREYIEFLKNANVTDSRGTLLHDTWAAVGKSAPVLMDDVSINLAPFVAGDVTGDGVVAFSDITKVLANFNASNNPGVSGGDANCDGVVNFADITFVLANYGHSV